MFIVYQIDVCQSSCTSMVLGSLTGISVNVLIIIAGYHCYYLLIHRRLKSYFDRLLSVDVLLIGVTFALIFRWYT